MIEFLFSLEFLSGLTLGLYAGVWLGRHWPAEKPLYARPRLTRFAMTPLVKVAPTGHFDQWLTWTRRFVLFAELLAHETGRPPNQLPSMHLMRAMTGMSARHFEPYLKVLRDGHVIYTVDRVGSWWINPNKRARRDALAALPYPGLSRPPRFPFTRDSGTGGTGGTERHQAALERTRETAYRKEPYEKKT